MSHTVFTNQESVAFNLARISHLNSLQLPFSKKEVAEFGAGIGLLTDFFKQMNSNVTAYEARQENIEEFNKNLPDVPIHQFDLEKDTWDSIKPTEIAFAYGLLYHLSNPKQFIENVAKKTTEFLLLETVVSVDGNEDTINTIYEDKHINIQSFSGTGCRPTRQFVWKICKENFPFVYVPRTQPKHPDFPLDFKVEKHHTMRFVIIASKVPIVHPLLSDILLDSYTYY